MQLSKLSDKARAADLVFCHACHTLIGTQGKAGASSEQNE